jgi:hypothetical protein
MKLALSFLLVVAFAVGQSPQDGDRTFGLFNGRFWLNLSPDQRRVYLLGVLDQLLDSENAESVALSKMLINAKKLTDEPTFREITTVAKEAAKNLPDMGGLNRAIMPSSIDQFYSESRNRVIPLTEALRFSIRKAQGEDPAQLAKEVADRAAHWRTPGTGFNN